MGLVQKFKEKFKACVQRSRENEESALARRDAARAIVAEYRERDKDEQAERIASKVVQKLQENKPN